MKADCSIPLTTIRTLDGSRNHALYPHRNSAGQTYQRRVEPSYEDTYERPNPRLVSNAVSAQSAITVDPVNLSGMSWAWGQFLDHDVVLTPAGETPDISIAVPAGDPHFDPQGLGRAVIPVARSLARYENGQREQYNQNSGWIDASMVYGSEPERAAALRTFEGGRLKESPGGYLPYNEQGLDNEDPHRGDPARLFLAGDKRANENLLLTSLQTLFLREHNRLVAEFAQRYPSAGDEELFQMARKVVGAQVQKITYDEYLPTLLGPDAMEPYQEYQPQVDASISNLFAAAAFRMGHSQVGPAIRRIEENGDAIEEGHLCLKAGFHQSHRLIEEGGLDPILRGSAEYLQETTDTLVVDDLRNFLFGAPGQGGLDLAAVNLARGRDHGLPSFNVVRREFGLEPLRSFSELTQDQDLAGSLEQTYGSVDKLDPWVGFLAETHRQGSAVGETLHRVLKDQFTRLRDGDRFFYLNDPDIARLAPDLGQTRLADIIKRNTGVVNIQDDVFLARDGELFDDPCRS